MPKEISMDVEKSSMSPYVIPYSLHKDGYIDHWLVAGPQTIGVSDIGHIAPDIQLQIARRHFESESGVTGRPQEWEPPLMMVSVPGGTAETFRWRYTRCLDDHLIDFSNFYPTCTYLRTWAYVEVQSPQTHQVTFHLTAYGPADLWLNGKHTHRQVEFRQVDHNSHCFTAKLRPGRNEILVRFEQVAAGACAYGLALQLTGLPAGPGSVLLPTGVDPERRLDLETLIEAAYLDRYVYGPDDPIRVRWPDDLVTKAMLGLSLQDHQGLTYEDVMYTEAEAAASYQMLRELQVRDAAY